MSNALELINEYFETDYKSTDEISDKELLKMLCACLLAANQTFKDEDAIWITRDGIHYEAPEM